jgi:nucleotide-binding universal stress UspA family protein
MLVMHPDTGSPSTREVPSARHILVPLDGSKLAEHVLGGASELALATGARLTLARVVAPTHSPGPAVIEVGGRHVDPEVERAVAYLEDTAVSLRGDGFTVSTHVAAATSPARALAQLAEQLDADLVAMATHGLGGVRRTVLGSVAEQLLRSTTRPVLVIRPPIAA